MQFVEPNFDKKKKILEKDPVRFAQQERYKIFY